MKANDTLGAALGTQAYTEQYVSCKAAQWAEELRKLSSIADIQPHMPYAALTHGLISKCMYLTRTIPNIGHLLQPLEDVIRTGLTSFLH